jgi:hypothetical protein
VSQAAGLTAGWEAIFSVCRPVFWISAIDIRISSTLSGSGCNEIFKLIFRDLCQGIFALAAVMYFDIVVGLQELWPHRNARF